MKEDLSKIQARYLENLEGIYLDAFLKMLAYIKEANVVRSKKKILITDILEMLTDGQSDKRLVEDIFGEDLYGFIDDSFNSMGADSFSEKFKTSFTTILMSITFVFIINLVLSFLKLGSAIRPIEGKNIYLRFDLLVNVLVLTLFIGLFSRRIVKMENRMARLISSLFSMGILLGIVLLIFYGMDRLGIKLDYLTFNIFSYLLICVFLVISSIISNKKLN